MAKSFTEYSSDCDKDGNLEKSFTLDKKSTEFLEEHLGSKINPEIKTITDYCRTVFYFKCCGIQEETNKNTASEHDFSINNCFFSKEKADILFENVYAHAKESDEFIQNMNKSMEAGIMPSDEDVEKMMKYQETGQVSRLMVMNDSIYSVLENKDDHTDFAKERKKEHEEIIKQTGGNGYIDLYTDGYTMSDIELPPELERENLLISDDASFYENIQKETTSGNKGILRTGNLSQFSGYLNAFPELQTELGDKYGKMCQIAKEQITPYLPENANVADYDAVIKEHPKAVMAFALSAQNEQQIASPEDLLQKCQEPKIIATSDNMSFSHDWESHIKLAKDAMFEFGKVAATRELAGNREVADLCMNNPTLAMVALAQNNGKQITNAETMKNMVQDSQNITLAQELTNSQAKSYSQIQAYVFQKTLEAKTYAGEGR